MKIRSLEKTDETEWRRLWAGYIDFYRAEVTEDVTGPLFARLMREGSHFGFVADGGDRLLGFVHGLPHASTWSVKEYCYLEDLYVDPSARGQGVGRQLIEKIYEEADRRDCSRVYWHTDSGNVKARALYDTLASLSDFVQYRRG